jgi:hypothetical protein
MALSFAFGGNTGETPESIARKRKIANALLASNTMPQNVGQGIAAIGDALAGRYMTSKLDAQDVAGQGEVGKLFGGLDFSGGGDNKYTVADTGAGAASTGAHSGSTNVKDPQIFDSFIGTVKEGGVTNPNALAAIAATGQHESGYSAKNVYGSWADPSESGKALTAGGVMSWNGPRYEAMKSFVAANGGDPNKPDPRLQAKYFLQEDPTLVANLNAAKSPEEAQQLMNNAWRFAGYDRPGGEAARRISSARQFAGKFAGSDAAPVQTASLDPSAGMGAPAPVQPNPAVTAALQPPTRVGSIIPVPSAEEVNGPPPVGVGGVPAGSGGMPVVDFGSDPRLSASAGIPFEQPQGMPTPSPVSAALTQPQTAPQPQPSVSDALLRKNDMALGGIMAPAGTPQPQGAALGGAFPTAPSPDRAPIPAGGGGFFPPAPSATPAGGGQDEAARMLKVINHPYATDAQKAYATHRLSVLEKQNDPSTQLDLQVKKAQLNALNKKDTSAEYKEVNKRLYRIDKATNEVTDVTPEAPGGAAGGKFRFDGQSVEGQALNGLMNSGVLTEQQAQEIAAGKTITDPSTGAITFLTPSGIVTQMPGQAPQPLTAAPSGAPAPTAPAPSGPASTTAPAPSGGPKEANEKNYPGMIQLTGGKSIPLIEAVRRNRQLYSVVKPELSTVEKNFDALTDPKNQAGNMMPGGNYITSDAYQQARNSLQAIIASYLYSTSGATANPGEVKNQADMLMPSPGEKAGSLAAKKRRIRTMVNAIAIGGDLPPQPDEEDNLPLEDLLKKYGG